MDNPSGLMLSRAVLTGDAYGTRSDYLEFHQLGNHRFDGPHWVYAFWTCNEWLHADESAKGGLNGKPRQCGTH